MKTLIQSFRLLLAISLGSCAAEQNDDWISLFNGKDLSGWRANESSASFKVVDGLLVANGLRSHLYYVGEGTAPADFKNFELTFDAMTHHLANSGVYFHTAFQDEGWLDTGYELQVNSTHRGAGGYKEVKKSGSLYGVRNLYKAYAKDSVWYTFYLRVDGKRIRVKIDDQLVVDYIEPTDFANPQNKKVLSRGAFALQGHDPESTVYFKNIRLKPLPDTAEPPVADVDAKPSSILKYQADHFAFIDYHIHTSNSFHTDSALHSFYSTGVNLGLAIDADQIEEGRETQILSRHVEKYRHLPVFLGIIKSNNKQLDAIPDSSLAQFDYVIGGITRFKNKAGEEVNILTERNVGDKEVFMDQYIKSIEDELDKGELNIWAMATILPESLSEEYNKLWTKKRMLKVINAAKRNDVAIEVHDPKRIPSIAFIKLAKEKGCLFTTGGLFEQNAISEPRYFFEVIDQCGLDYKDIYIAGNPN